MRRAELEIPGNVGVPGRPPHHHGPDVGYAVLRFASSSDRPRPELACLAYDPAPVAAAIRGEGLPEAFAMALECGAWITCTGILPAHEGVIANRYVTPAAPIPPSKAQGRHARDTSSA
jgi:hypothetical protein